MRLILSILLLLACWSANAATVTGNLIDLFGENAGGTITFSNTLGAQIIGTSLNVSKPKSVALISGSFTNTLVTGNYLVTAGGHQFRINVPDSAATFRIEDLATNLVTYTYTNQPTFAVSAGTNVSVSTNGGLVTISSTINTNGLISTTNAHAYTSLSVSNSGAAYLVWSGGNLTNSDVIDTAELNVHGSSSFVETPIIQSLAGFGNVVPLLTDAGTLQATSVTAEELSFVSGVTDSIQGQLNGFIDLIDANTTAIAGNTTTIASHTTSIAGKLTAASNLSDVANAVTARSNLGLGTAATQASGTFAQVANNGSDFSSLPTAKSNLVGGKINLVVTTVPPLLPTPSLGSGDYEGQVLKTKYGMQFWWNGAAWRAEQLIPGVLKAGSTNSLYCTSSDINHALYAANGMDNVLELRNFDNAHYSAMRFTDKDGSEVGAIGYANTGAAVAPGDLYYETFGLLHSIWFVSGVTFIGGVQKVTGDLVWFQDGTTNTTIFKVNRANSQTTVSGFGAGITTQTVDYSVARANYTVLINGATKTATLPTAVGFSGEIHTIKLIASGTTGTVATTSSQTIDGSTTYSLSARYKYVTVQSDGANWHIIANN